MQPKDDPTKLENEQGSAAHTTDGTDPSEDQTFDDAVTEQAEAEIEEASEAFEEAVAEIEATAAEIEDARADIEEVDAEIEETDAEIAEARAEIEDARAEIEDARAEIEAELDNAGPDRVSLDQPDSDHIAAAPATETPAATAQPPARRRGGFFPLLLGGIVAGGIGFAAAQTDWAKQTLATLGVPVDTATDTALAELSARIDALKAQSDATAAALSALDGLSDRVSASAADAVAASVKELEDMIVVLGDRIVALETAAPSAVAGASDDAIAALAELQVRLEALESRGVGTPTAGTAAATEAAVAAVREQAEAELSAIKDRMAAAADETEARISAAEAKAMDLESAAAGAARDLTLGRLRTLAMTGEPYENAVAALQADGVTDLPEALIAEAKTGIATLSALERAWPQAARAGLDAALKAGLGPDATTGDRVTAFLSSQLGARSLEPHDGDDPDAILSRAGAAVERGDIDAALAELAALPEAGQQAMAEWIARAQARQAALAALATYGGDAAQ